MIRIRPDALYLTRTTVRSYVSKNATSSKFRVVTWWMIPVDIFLHTIMQSATKVDSQFLHGIMQKLAAKTFHTTVKMHGQLVTRFFGDFSQARREPQRGLGKAFSRGPSYRNLILTETSRQLSTGSTFHALPSLDGPVSPLVSWRLERAVKRRRRDN